MYTTFRKTVSKYWRNLETDKLRWILIGLCAAILLVTLTSIQMSRIYSSDDVVVQNIFQSWQDGSAHEAHIGADNFILKLPFYTLQDMVMENSRAKLFIAVLVFNAVFLVGLILIIEKLVRPLLRNKWAVLGAYLPAAWFIGTYVYSQSVWRLDQSKIATLANPNSRNLEIGVAFILMILVALYLEGKLDLKQRWRKIALIAGAPLLGLYFFSDPYFVYCLGGAVVLASAVLWFVKKLGTLRAAYLLGYFVLCLVFAQIIKWLVAMWGYHSISNISTQLVSFENLWGNISNALHALFVMFGGDFWGGNVNLKTAIYVVNAVALLFGLIALIYACRRKFILQPLNLLLVCAFVASTGAYVITINGSADTWRYLIFPALCLVPLTAQWLVHIAQKKPNMRLLGSLLGISILAIVMNLVLNLRIIGIAATQPANARPNQNSMIVVDALKKHGLTKGYANYWVGPLNTYFANRSSVMLPLVCNQNGELAKFNWLVNYPDFHLTSKQTFFLQDTTNPIRGCMDKGTEHVFGPADRIIKVSDIYTLYVYDRDIAAPLPSVSSGETK